MKILYGLHLVLKSMPNVDQSTSSHATIVSCSLGLMNVHCQCTPPQTVYVTQGQLIAASVLFDVLDPKIMMSQTSSLIQGLLGSC